MRTSTSRRLIAAMHVTLDGRILGPEGEVDWVDSWPLEQVYCAVFIDAIYVKVSRGPWG